MGEHLEKTEGKKKNRIMQISRSEHLMEKANQMASQHP